MTLKISFSWCARSLLLESFKKIYNSQEKRTNFVLIERSRTYRLRVELWQE